ncbi:MAG: hypothetical protein ACYDBJ_12955 [Aggregatilineales bacterium]
MTKTVRECHCADCRGAAAHPNKVLHHQMNLFVSRLDEQQRRWYVALESKKVGHGGDTLLAQIMGMDVETNRRGRGELDGELASGPTEHTRQPGGGQPSVEKKTRPSSRN